MTHAHRITGLFFISALVVGCQSQPSGQTSSASRSSTRAAMNSSSVAQISSSSNANAQASSTTPASSAAGSAQAAASAAQAQDTSAVVASKLNIPWNIAFLPSGDMLVTERPGTLVRIGKNEQRYPIAGVHHQGEGGLLGIALHPNFKGNGLVYLYLTTNQKGVVTNRVERYVYENDQLKNRIDILTDIPGSVYHDGGRIAFGPDGFLYITTGDAGNENAAQDTNSLAGKILRVTDNGSIPADNPFGNAVYSFGHRNPQGLAWDNQKRLWSTEHGRSGAASGFDELNLIERGKNYGWPVIQGSETRDGMVTPVLHSGANDTWAPASAVYHDGSIFFGGLRGEALYEAVLPTDRDAGVILKTHLKGVYGRIRDVVLGPDGFLYLTTSNRDGRGKPTAEDDRVLRIGTGTLK